MKAISQAIQKRTGKPESYIAVSIQDQADVIFGGTEDPTALGTLYSIGAISQESNGAITNDVTDLLSEFGVPENRIYINFFDMVSFCYPVSYRVVVYLLYMQSCVVSKNMYTIVFPHTLSIQTQPRANVGWSRRTFAG